jgi:hypothetical protein
MPTLISPVDDLRDAFVAMATEFAEQGEPRYMVETRDFSAYLAALRERQSRYLAPDLPPFRGEPVVTPPPSRLPINTE